MATVVSHCENCLVVFSKSSNKIIDKLRRTLVYNGTYRNHANLSYLNHHYMILFSTCSMHLRAHTPMDNVDTWNGNNILVTTSGALSTRASRSHDRCNSRRLQSTSCHHSTHDHTRCIHKNVLINQMLETSSIYLELSETHRTAAVSMRKFSRDSREPTAVSGIFVAPGIDGIPHEIRLCVARFFNVIDQLFVMCGSHDDSHSTQFTA